MILIFSLSMFVFIFSFFFSGVSSLYLMVSLLITQTACLSAFNYVYSSEHWVSYVLILVFMGGLMVIFAYMVSLVPKELVSKMSLVWFFFPVFLFFLFFLSGLMSVTSQVSVPLSESNISDGMAVFMSMFSFIFSIVYLLIALLSVSTILLRSEGPLRAL